MFSRRLLLSAGSGAILAAVTFAAPAAATVTYDPQTKTGFVDRADVQKAFGWTDAELAARAAEVVFQHDFWTDDTYAVSCGSRSFPVVHHKDYGHFELTDTVVEAGERGAAGGYGRQPAGFKITGSSAGISGTSVAPAPGQPCPEAEGKQIDKVHLRSSITGWALTISSKSAPASHRILVHEVPAAG